MHSADWRCLFYYWSKSCVFWNGLAVSWWLMFYGRYYPNILPPFQALSASVLISAPLPVFLYFSRKTCGSPAFFDMRLEVGRPWDYENWFY